MSKFSEEITDITNKSIIATDLIKLELVIEKNYLKKKRIKE